MPSRLLCHASTLALAGLLLVAAGQPLHSEDAWWHLSMGEVHAREGPWLEADPLLHTATAPPAPAAWLFDLALHGVVRVAGFQGARVLHGLSVAAILALAWGLLRRTSASTAYASLATSAFGVLAAYRLFQLRPHLVTILGVVLVLLLLARWRVPSWRRIAAVGIGFALWANLHGAFVLGLGLLGAAAAAQALAALRSPAARDRLRWLLLALGVATVGSLLNPQGARQHLLYFQAGARTPSLAVVVDEWAPVALFALPTGGSLPPSPATWALLWIVLLACAAVAVLHLRQRRGVDPALAGAAALGLPLMLGAVRLVWLALPVLVLLGRSLRPLRDARRRSVDLATSAAAALLLAAFVWAGPWPMISRGVHTATFSLPYAVSKHDAHAVWFLRDAGLSGNLFNDYATGNFLGYWLAPRLRPFVNGSLNLPREAMDAALALRSGSGSGGLGFGELLDRYRVDVFFGTGLPVVAAGGRPTSATTTFLEDAPGWIPIFRSVRSGLYLRDHPRNRVNLRRVAAYYARAGVPFDPEHGFSPQRVMEAAPRWSLAHGLVPVGFGTIRGAETSTDAGRTALHWEATVYALLGLYDAAAAVDARILRDGPDLAALRRRTWSLIRAGRSAESRRAAAALAAAAAPGDGLAALLVATARSGPGEDGARRLARLPLLHRAESERILSRFLAAEVRPPPARRRAASPSRPVSGAGHPATGKR